MIGEIGEYEVPVLIVIPAVSFILHLDVVGIELLFRERHKECMIIRASEGFNY